MALPDVDALKRTLKIEHTAEDTLLAEELVRATGLVQRFIGTPIVGRADSVYYDEATNNPRTLVINETPVDPEEVEIEDRDGTALDVSLLRINPETGVIRYRDGLTRFSFGPYKITATVGLDTLDTYALEIEPTVSQAIVDTVADLYYRRNPAALNEASNGINRSYNPASGLPLRVEAALTAGVKRAL